jgi:hypothetical protein
MLRNQKARRNEFSGLEPSLIKLEAEHSADQQPTSCRRTKPRRNRVGDAGNGKTSPWLDESGIFDKRIDALEVHMVENVQGRGVKFERGTLIELETFEYGRIRRIGDCIRGDVSRRVAKRSSEYSLGNSGVGNKPHLIVGNSCDVLATNSGSLI